MPIFLGFMMVICQIGWQVFGIELSSTLKWVHLGNCSQQYTKIITLTFNISMPLTFLLISCFHQKLSSFFFCLLVSITTSFFVSIIFWLPRFFIALLILGFAYPLYVTGLIAFHIGYAYVLSVLNVICINPLFNDKKSA